LHVDMTGQGCRQYESLHGDDWKNTLKLVFDRQGHFARIDVAIDDYDGMLSLPVIREKIDKRQVTSRFKIACGIIEYDLSGEPNSNKGETIYLGSPQSRIKIRFYDKVKQQKADYLWTRAEIECHNDSIIV
jgi:phage replication initiation protein